jgi:tRNA dimethylallyltransferase
MQVYRGMDIGTAKPTSDERAEVPHHLLDLADPDERFSVARFQEEADRAIAAIDERGHRALLVGGTGLYFQAVVDRLAVPGEWPEVREELGATGTDGLYRRLEVLDPSAAARIEPTNRRRVVRALEVTLGSGRPFSSFGPGVDAYPPTPIRLTGVWLPRAALAQRIDARLRAQRAERTVAVVVEQLVRAVGIDEEEIEIAVVIRVEKRAADGLDIAAIRFRLLGDVFPLPFLDLTPKLVRPVPREVDEQRSGRGPGRDVGTGRGDNQRCRQPRKHGPTL